jgi:hypothetical protein
VEYETGFVDGLIDAITSLLDIIVSDDQEKVFAAVERRIKYLRNKEKEKRF